MSLEPAQQIVTVEAATAVEASTSLLRYIDSMPRSRIDSVAIDSVRSEVAGTTSFASTGVTLVAVLTVEGPAGHPPLVALRG